MEEGGETTLPLAQAIDEAAQQLEAPSACAARMGLAVHPRKGDALMFFDMDIQVREWRGGGEGRGRLVMCPFKGDALYVLRHGYWSQLP